MQRAIITGITGFAGGHLAEHLLSQGDAVLGLGAERTWPSDTPTAIMESAELVTWDLGDATRGLDAIVEHIAGFEPTVIYHLAAVSTPGDCGERQPNALALSVNVAGTERVLQLAERLPSKPRVVFVSSSHVYDPCYYRWVGDEASVPEDAEEHPPIRYLTEDAPIGPLRGYGMTKRLAEEAVLRVVAENGADAVIVRAFQHIGPRQKAMRLMLPEWMLQLHLKREAPINVHSLDAYVDVTDVRDVVRAYRLVAEKAVSGDIFNVGSGIARRTGDLVEMLMDIAGQRRPISERRPGRRLDPVADITRLTELTGWRPEFAMEQTLADTWAEWCQRVGRSGCA